MIAIRLVAMVAMLQGPGSADTVPYSDPVLGLAFDRPKSWVEGKKTRDISRYTIPLPETSETAELEIVRTPFHSSKEIWNTIQIRVNEQLKREVVRQWEQDVLDVPVLFTQVSYTDKGTAKTMLSGLYYTRTPVKLMFKLTTGTAEFEKAQFALQESLQSLRTLDGSTPKVDDEDVPLTVPKTTPVAPPKVKVIKDRSIPDKPALTAVDVPLTVSTKSLSLKLPEGWRAEGVEGSKLTLRHEDLSGPIQIEVRNTLDSDAPLTALFKLSSKSLEEFASVGKREDTSNQVNGAGCSITTVWRIGKAASGDLMIHEVCGVQNDFYFLATYRLTNPSALPAERKLIRSLLDAVSLQPGA